MSVAFGLSIVVVLGLAVVVPLVLFQMIRSETRTERMDRETAEQVVRRDRARGSDTPREGTDDRSSDDSWGQ